MRPACYASYLIVAASVLAAGAKGEEPAQPVPGHSVHGEAFYEGPHRAAHRMPGMGKVHFPVTTAKPEAQAFVNQGVAQLHSFFYYEAERSFREAARIDPDCAMTYWGMAMANILSPKRARLFLKDARKRDAKLTAREKLYLDALEAFYKEGASDKDRKEAFVLGLETIVQEHPRDLDAKAWLALVTDARAWLAHVPWKGPPDGGGIGSRQAVDTLLESILQVDPSHPGAHHYRIHLWDGKKPARALASAALYGPSAPGIAHAWHMPGHTYSALHRYADAAHGQEASARVDHAYMLRDRVMPFEIHNYAHNNQWLSLSLSHVGRVRDAIAVARNLVEQPRDPEKNAPKESDSPQRAGRLRWAEVLTRYELWDDLIAATTGGQLDWSGLPAERREKGYRLGLAYSAKNDRANLDAQVKALKTLAAEEAEARKGSSAKKDSPNPYVKGAPDRLSTDAAIAELEGYQFLADGKIGLAFERFTRATSMRPEALARAHLAARNHGLAESVAESAVAKQPNQVPPLAAQVEVLSALGKTKAAQDAYGSLAAIARDADQDLPVFRRLKPIVASWNSDKTSTPPSTKPHSNEAGARRVDLSKLGPLTWSPAPALPLVGTDTQGKAWSLADQKGKNVVVLFFLGGKCAHCMQQLQKFGKELETLRALDTELVAVSTDDLDGSRALKENTDGVGFPMPILPDPTLEAFKKYAAFDDFEDQPLHGIYLIDAKGYVRFQRISADPFLDVAFVKSEAARVNALVKSRAK
jgi:peroxiredoxin/tetratricopeptide (TPR) repeat protein